MQKNDLVIEAQSIIDNYAKKQQSEKASAGYEFMKKYSEMKLLEAKRKNRAILLNFILMSSLLILCNLIIYLAYLLNYAK